MADETAVPGASPTAAHPHLSGNGVKRDRTAIMAVALVLSTCVLIHGGMMGAVMIAPPGGDWNIVAKVVDHLGSLELILAGGLLAYLKQGTH